jgi:hypothetical protein
VKWSTFCPECNCVIGEVLGLDAPDKYSSVDEAEATLGCGPDSPGLNAKQLKAQLKKIVRERNKKPPALPTRMSKCMLMVSILLSLKWMN